MTTDEEVMDMVMDASRRMPPGMSIEDATASLVKSVSKTGATDREAVLTLASLCVAAFRIIQNSEQDAKDRRLNENRQVINDLAKIIKQAERAATPRREMDFPTEGEGK